MSVPFRERNPVIVGAVSLAVITAMIMAAFRAEDLPLIGGGDTYYAAFSEAGGLKANDEVRVAGVRVGKVQSVDLDGDHVRVEFTVERGVDFGAETAANIKVKTLLGAMYLALDPAGSGQLEEGAEIPRERTTSPYDVVDAFEGLASTSERIDTDRLATSLDTLSTLMQDTPEEFRGALRGMSALSQNIAARDAQLNELLGNMQKVSKVLADRNGDLVTLMEDGDKLFRALVARREAVHNLLVATSQLSRRAHAPGAPDPGRPQARAGQPRQRGRHAQPEPGEPRQQPAADGAVLPGVREHPRHRSVVRHLHPEPSARAPDRRELT